MFLFERLKDEEENISRRILYTGDFRFENLQQSIDNGLLSGLLGLNGQPKSLDELYLDTTFCSTDYETFPTRDSAEKSIWELVEGWIRKNGRCIMYILRGPYEL